MDFVSLGDSIGFDRGGQQCAEAVRAETWDWRGCYSTLRPVGILGYYALPYLLGRDAIEVRYIALFLNLVMAAVLCAALLAVLRSQPGFQGSPPPVRIVAQGALLLALLACLTPFVPVTLSDHQSLAMLLLAYALLSSRGFSPGTGACALAGLAAASAVLLKQNHVVTTAVLLGLWCSGLQGPRPRLRQLLAFGATFALIGVQFWMTWQASGLPWLYEPAALEPFAPSNRQPVVELTAYTDPVRSAYLSSLERPVSEFAYFAAKFVHGVGVFHWSVYLGRAPLEQLPQVLAYTDEDLLGFQLVFAACLLVALASVFLRSRSLTLLVWTAMAFTCFSTAIAHTEFRYFLFFRVAAVLYGVALACHLTGWVAARRARRTGQAAPGLPPRD